MGGRDDGRDGARPFRLEAFQPASMPVAAVTLDDEPPLTAAEVTIVDRGWKGMKAKHTTLDIIRNNLKDTLIISL